MALFNFKKQNDDYDVFTGDDSYYGKENSFGDVDGDMTDEGFAAPAPTPAEPAVFGTSVSLKIVNPKSHTDASEIADYLMNGNTVLLNIESLDPAQAIRLLDYLAGATHAVGGIITKVGKTTIVVAPKNVDVSSIEAMVGGN